MQDGFFLTDSMTRKPFLGQDLIISIHFSIPRMFKDDPSTLGGGLSVMVTVGPSSFGISQFETHKHDAECLGV